MVEGALCNSVVLDAVSFKFKRIGYLMVIGLHVFEE